MSRGVDPQFLVPYCGPGGWFRIRFKMSSEGRARVEIRVDTGHGLRTVECLERTSFTGTIDRQFFVNVPQPVHGFRFDPLDMEGQFRLEILQIQPVTRLGLLSRALWGALRQARLNGQTFMALANGLKSLLRGRIAEIKKKLLANVRGPSPLAPPAQDQDRVYQTWRHRRQLTAATRARMMAEAAVLPGAPLISILLPLSTNSASNLRPALASVLRQLYPRWELCIAGHDSMAASVRSVLAHETRKDARIRTCFDSNNRGRASALNSALALAAGDYCALLDPEDEFADEALFRVAQAITAEGQFDLLYTDEDRIEPTGQHVAPFFKPDWSPEYLLSLPYIGSLSVYRTTLLRELGGFRETFEPAEEYDLALQVAARSPRVHHLAEVLYHRRRPCTSPEAAEAGRRALASYLKEIGRPGSVTPGSAGTNHRVRFAISGRSKISIIIPTAYRYGNFCGERTTYLARCLASIRAKSTYPNYEILLFDNDELPPEILKALTRWQVHRTPYLQPFNWAATMNRAASLAGGEHLLFLDDDTEVITPGWLECLLEYSQQPEIGAVGSRLHFPDDRLQHAGIAILDGAPGHPFAGYPEDHPGYFLSSVVPRNWSAVTGACLMTRAEVFHALGGFTEHFAYYFNDVDYCLKVSQGGRRVVCNPHARLYHYETVTKSAVVAGEYHDFQEVWKQRRPVDPFYNPNLSTRFYDFRLEPE
jgi:GT2 family glycosyltransferase